MADKSGEQAPEAQGRICGMSNHTLKTPNVTINDSKMLKFARKMNPDLRHETPICMECFRSLVKVYSKKNQGNKTSTSLDPNKSISGDTHKTSAAHLNIASETAISQLCGLGTHLLMLPKTTIKDDSGLLGVARYVNPEMRSATPVCMECFKSLEKLYKMKLQYARKYRTKKVDDTLDVSDVSSESLDDSLNL
ncbi:uncharacterized protein LOC6599608 [Drosophila persimilis]|nr:uncharacterized protein LOC6599608 [Drosophila persimilis]